MNTSENKYFNISDKTTVDELKSQYKILSKKHHPDNGGSNEVMAEINLQYKAALEELQSMAQEKEDTDLYDYIADQIELHINSLYSKVKKKLPKQYQIFLDSVETLFPKKS